MEQLADSLDEVECDGETVTAQQPSGAAAQNPIPHLLTPPPPSAPHSLNEGGPNSPISNAFARMNHHAAQSAPPAQPLIEDLDYTLLIPPPVMRSINAEPEQDSRSQPKRGGIRKGSGVSDKENHKRKEPSSVVDPTDSHGEGGRRKSRRLGSKPNSGHATPQGGKGRKKKGAATSGWVEVFANTEGTGLEDADGNPIPLLSIPRAYARDLLPGLNI